MTLVTIEYLFRGSGWYHDLQINIHDNSRPHQDTELCSTFTFSYYLQPLLRCFVSCPASLLGSDEHPHLFVPQLNRVWGLGRRQLLPPLKLVEREDRRRFEETTSSVSKWALFSWLVLRVRVACSRWLRLALKVLFHKYIWALAAKTPACCCGKRHCGLSMQYPGCFVFFPPSSAVISCPDGIRGMTWWSITRQILHPR